MASYEEFEWQGAGPGNQATGKGLADALVARIRTLSEVRRVCDLGCGNGYLSGRLADLDYEVIGVDASESGVQIARGTHPKAKFVCELIDRDLAARADLEPCDLVISSEVIEHLYRPADLLEAASSLLDHRGHLILSTPYHGYWKNVALSVSGKMDSHFTALVDCGHIKFFSVKTLSQLLRQYGFDEVQFSYYGRAPWLWMSMICHARKSR